MPDKECVAPPEADKFSKWAYPYRAGVPIQNADYPSKARLS